MIVEREPSREATPAGRLPHGWDQRPTLPVLIGPVRRSAMPTLEKKEGRSKRGRPQGGGGAAAGAEAEAGVPLPASGLRAWEDCFPAVLPLPDPRWAEFALLPFLNDEEAPPAAAPLPLVLKLTLRSLPGPLPAWRSLRASGDTGPMRAPFLSTAVVYPQAVSAAAIFSGQVDKGLWQVGSRIFCSSSQRSRPR